MLLSLILMLVVTIVAVFFAAENPTTIQVTFLGLPIRGTAGVLGVLAFALGFLLGILALLPAMLSRSVAMFRQRKRLAELEKKPTRRRATGKEQ